MAVCGCIPPRESHLLFDRIATDAIRAFHTRDDAELLWVDGQPAQDTTRQNTPFCVCLCVCAHCTEFHAWLVNQPGILHFLCIPNDVNHWLDGGERPKPKPLPQMGVYYGFTRLPSLRKPPPTNMSQNVRVVVCVWLWLREGRREVCFAMCTSLSHVCIHVCVLIDVIREARRGRRPLRMAVLAHPAGHSRTLRRYDGSDRQRDREREDRVCRRTCTRDGHALTHSLTHRIKIDREMDG